MLTDHDGNFFLGYMCNLKHNNSFCFCEMVQKKNWTFTSEQIATEQSCYMEQKTMKNVEMSN